MKSKIAFILKSAFWCFIAAAAIWRLLAFVSPAVYSTKFMVYFLVCYLIIFAGWFLVGLSRRKKEKKRIQQLGHENQVSYQIRLEQDKKTYLKRLSPLNAGAKDKEISHFQYTFWHEFGGTGDLLAPEYIDFLRHINGININAYQLFGTNELIEKNYTWQNRHEYLVGETPDWYYVYDVELQKYLAYDKEKIYFDEIADSFDAFLVDEFLSELIEHLPLTDAERIQKYLNFCLKLRNSIDRDDFTALANAYEKWDANLKMSVKESISPFVWSKINQENFRENQSFRQLKELHDDFYNAWMTKYR
ncbi:hypothetical protein GHI93_02760 [Lactococcus hircilactis]|uniref:Uncharacterized protein n=1 Tax=Lactococcus hircilactis TaxID=1494462 RepID=A0A7X2D022_9LACT|nr:hypothetical protein [Lactococcus hircilactis]MQW38871.1 hypothetical protein [Lactococcus hircilactis]